MCINCIFRLGSRHVSRRSRKLCKVLLFFFWFAWISKFNQTIPVCTLWMAHRGLGSHGVLNVAESGAQWPMCRPTATKVSHILLFFFRFAWLSKVQLPTILTVIFLAFNIRVRLDINIDIWESSARILFVINQDFLLVWGLITQNSGNECDD